MPEREALKSSVEQLSGNPSENGIWQAIILASCHWLRSINQKPHQAITYAEDAIYHPHMKGLRLLTLPRLKDQTSE